jgi:acetyltransferase-like isoleucine patch superfamily enzyme
MISRQSKGIDRLVRLLGIVRKKYEAFKLGEDVDLDYVENIKSLIARGLKLGKNVTIGGKVLIDTEYPYLISVGSNCAIGTGTRILAHDDTPYKYTGGYAHLGQVNILDNVFMGRPRRASAT